MRTHAHSDDNHTQKDAQPRDEETQGDRVGRRVTDGHMPFRCASHLQVLDSLELCCFSLNLVTWVFGFKVEDLTASLKGHAEKLEKHRGKTEEVSVEYEVIRAELASHESVDETTDQQHRVLLADVEKLRAMMCRDCVVRLHVCVNSPFDLAPVSGSRRRGWRGAVGGPICSCEVRLRGMFVAAFVSVVCRCLGVFVFLFCFVGSFV